MLRGLPRSKRLFAKPEPGSSRHNGVGDKELQPRSLAVADRPPANRQPRIAFWGCPQESQCEIDHRRLRIRAAVRCIADAQRAAAGGKRCETVAATALSASAG